MLKHDKYDFIVIGGGFFGAVLASELASAGNRVALCEKESDLMQRASYVNQARVHNGYHYPRSLLTALRSRVNFPRFTKEFSSAIVSDFRKLYAIPRQFSKVSARQFQRFMEHIGAPIELASQPDENLFDMKLIEQVFSCVEYAFDTVRLKDIVWRRLQESGAEVGLQTRVARLAPGADGLKCHYVAVEGEGEVTAREVLNCTYSQINELLVNSELPRIRLKHELTEMALIEPPEELRSLGVTVMCGPFFSCMPFPARQLHTLSHVRYTPHVSWEDSDETYINSHEWFVRAPKVSHFPHMIRASARYLPCLNRAVHRDSLWEVKTILPQSEGDDSRPILFRRNQGLPGLTCIMGGKIDNIYDALVEFREESVTP